MTVDIEKLKELAGKASKGPWQTELAYPIVQPAYPARGAICSALIWPDARFIAAANPAAVLELCSDNEALRGLYQMHKQTETREMRDLKAELAGLKTGYEAYERVNAELRAECEGLRKDADRYQWLREPEAGNIEVVEWIGPHAASLVGDDMDSVVDAAMSKEASNG